jgi:hypothetical protein
VTDSNSTDCRVSIALLHYPVYDKNRKVVVTAITNLDLHDIARASRTFGLRRYYVVTPVPGQQGMAGMIGKHWREGWGAGYNPKRKAAFELVTVMPSLDEVLAAMERESGNVPRIVVTGAAGQPGALSCAALAKEIRSSDRSYLLLFGTGWGLTEEVFARADVVLEPVRGPGAYNHLSVRSAVAIILDRLFGRLEPEVDQP